MIRIHTRDFGDIEIAEDKILSFPNGLLGFSDNKRFALIADPSELAEEKAVFYWLQSLDDADIAFCLVDLIKLAPDYNPLVEEDQLTPLLPYNTEDLLIYNMAVIPENPKELTVNMKAPIVINPQNRQGMQAVCQNEDYAIRHRLFQPNIQAKHS